MADFAGATQRARALDKKIMGDGAAISQTYADLLAFSSRLSFGVLDITTSTSNPGDTQIFLKDIGRSR